MKGLPVILKNLNIGKNTKIKIYYSSFEVLKNNNFKMKLLEVVRHKTKKELLEHEQFHKDSRTDTVNLNNPSTSLTNRDYTKKYYASHVKERAIADKKYRQEHREQKAVIDKRYRDKQKEATRLSKL